MGPFELNLITIEIIMKNGESIIKINKANIPWIDIIKSNKIIIVANPGCIDAGKSIFKITITGKENKDENKKNNTKSTDKYAGNFWVNIIILSDSLK